MSEFYKELKELRESQKISLEEISERTKINVQYLQDIENGAFEDIETPYLRLFLRAYAEEIGSDSQRALEQLDSFSGNNKIPITQTNILAESSNFELKKSVVPGTTVDLFMTINPFTSENSLITFSTTEISHEPSLFIGVGTQTKTTPHLFFISSIFELQIFEFKSYVKTLKKFLNFSKTAFPTKPWPTIPKFIASLLHSQNCRAKLKI